MRQLIQRFNRQLFGLLVVLSLSLSMMVTASAVTPSHPYLAYDFQQLFLSGTYKASNVAMGWNETCSSSSTVYKVGRFDAQNSYYGAILYIGDPVGFLDLKQSDGVTYMFPNRSSGDVNTWLGKMAACYEQGYNSISSSPLIWLGFSNNVKNSLYTTGGDYAGSWTYSNANFVGAWVDFEGGWSPSTALTTILSAYQGASPYSGWRDSGWRAGMSYTDYKSYIDQAGAWTGDSYFLYPQNYLKNMYQCADYPINNQPAPCTSSTPNPGAYVSGVMVNSAQDNNSQWHDYQSHPYPYLTSSFVIIYTAYQYGVTYSMWSAYQ
jgi:hypothetical protein